MTTFPREQSTGLHGLKDDDDDDDEDDDTKTTHTADAELVFMVAFFPGARFDMTDIFSRILGSDFGDRQPILTVNHVILGVRVTVVDVEVRVVVALEDVECVVRFSMCVR